MKFSFLIVIEYFLIDNTTQIDLIQIFHILTIMIHIFVIQTVFLKTYVSFVSLESLYQVSSLSSILLENWHQVL